MKKQPNIEMMAVYRFDVIPVPKPRMTVSDKWKHREIVTRYFGYRDMIRYRSNLQGLSGLPSVLSSLIFTLPMPGSWSQKKKDLMRGKPHQQVPDLDNLIKGFCDVWTEDKHIHSIKNLEKRWDDFGSIELIIDQDQLKSA